jgi:hypothetical protein
LWLEAGARGTTERWLCVGNVTIANSTHEHWISGRHVDVRLARLFPWRVPLGGYAMMSQFDATSAPTMLRDGLDIKKSTEQKIGS